MDRMDCMILQGAFTYFYLAAVLGSDSMSSNHGSALSSGLGTSRCMVDAAASGQGLLTAEEVAAVAAHLTDEEQLRLTRMLFDKSRV